MTNQSKKIYLTPEGLEKIQKELFELKEEKRPKAVERLSLARMQGDLSENAEYVSAREDLAFIDERIDELQEILANAQLVQNDKSGQKVAGIGSKITVRVGDKEMVYSLVGDWEANPLKGRISISSPLGQALQDKKEGDEVEFEAPAGKIVYQIVKIE